MDNPITIAITGLSQPPAMLVAALPIHLHSIPLIQINPVVPVPAIPPADWVFWSSRQAVLTLCREPVLSTYRHAVLGAAEAEAVTQAGWQVGWQAPEAIGPSAAKAFSSWLPGRQHIWWPGSNQANPLIGRALSSHGHMVTITRVYQTTSVIVPQPVPWPDVWIFNSPSCVASFKKQPWLEKLLSRQLKSDGPLLRTGALGPTTAAAIRQQLGLTAVVANPSGDWASLLQAILSADN